MPASNSNSRPQPSIWIRSCSRKSEAHNQRLPIGMLPYLTKFPRTWTRSSANMSNLLEITLGIMTAMGGFVDVSELVFTAQAGSRFLYALIWVIALGTFIIIVFGEMSGRVAAISKQPLFNLMRQRLGLKFGLVILGAASIVNSITCAAEIGGIGIVLHLGLGIPYRLATSLATIALIAIVWLLPFKAIERVFGLLGLFMITFIVAAAAIHPPWNEVVAGLIPNIPAHLSGNMLLTYAYFIVAIISAVVFPYETYFYSAGAIEEHWSKKDLMVNRLTTIVGFILGSLLAISILVNAAVLVFAAPHRSSIGRHGRNGSCDTLRQSWSRPCAARYVFRNCRGRYRNLPMRGLRPLPILRLEMGSLRTTERGASIYFSLDRKLRAGKSHRSHRRRSLEPCRMGGRIGDSRDSVFLFAFVAGCE